MATWTVTIAVTDLARKIGTVTGTRTETLGEVEDVRSYTLAKVRFVQDGKTIAQIRGEIDAALFDMHERAAAIDVLKTQIANNEAQIEDLLNAREAV